MAKHLARASGDNGHRFNAQAFVDEATNALETMELKERAAHITHTLENHLPPDFPNAASILVDSLETERNRGTGEFVSAGTDDGIGGWAVMSMADYVARYGQDHVPLSLETLKTMTSRFSSEFAIRPFLQNHQKLTLKTISKWVEDDLDHVRRLVSEGTRPRLPWGMQLKAFITDPTPVLKLLERLKDDPSEYVRRSVANNLNDISKDHPDLIANLATDWMKDASTDRQRLIRHALRSLIKASHPVAFKALGYAPAKVSLKNLNVLTPQVVLGEALEFEAELCSNTTSRQPLIIDYVVHHVRAGGKTTPKVFKWKTVTLKGQDTLRATRRHPIKPITTRRYYSGLHRVEVMINGITLGGQDFVLKVK